MRQDSLQAIGQRLTHIRASASQRDHAVALGVPLRTYQNYERGDREPDLRTVHALYALGWNTNWLFTGEGPERLDAMQAAERPAPHGSHELSGAKLNIALEMAEERLRRDDLWLPKADFAELVVLILGKLQQGWDYARIRTYVSDQLQKLSKGESDAGSGRGVDAESGGSVVEGETKGPGQGRW